MKIAITSMGEGAGSEMDQRFGRAKYFMIYDTETKEYETLSNTDAAGGVQGAGIKTGELLSKNGVEVVITGHCGPKAFSVLAAAKIKVVMNNGGTVTEAVRRFLKEELGEADGPDVESHWT